LPLLALSASCKLPPPAAPPSRRGLTPQFSPSLFFGSLGLLCGLSPELLSYEAESLPSFFFFRVCSSKRHCPPLSKTDVSVFLPIETCPLSLIDSPRSYPPFRQNLSLENSLTRSTPLSRLNVIRLFYPLHSLTPPIPRIGRGIFISVFLPFRCISSQVKPSPLVAALEQRLST